MSLLSTSAAHLSIDASTAAMSACQLVSGDMRQRRVPGHRGQR